MGQSSFVLQRRITDAPAETSTPRSIAPEPARAVFDGSLISVTVGSKTATCAAFTSEKAPIPDGLYCIRRQGETQVKDRIGFGRWRIPVGETVASFLGQSHAEWFLLEPQFSMAIPRSRLHLHAGGYSEGCVTLHDKECFRKIAILLNSADATVGLGYDGNPPGSSAGYQDAEAHNVDCVGWLEVSKSRTNRKVLAPGATIPGTVTSPQLSGAHSGTANDPSVGTNNMTSERDPEVAVTVPGMTSGHAAAIPDSDETSPATSLIRFVGSNFVGAPVIADTDFVPALERINSYARQARVLVHVTSSFRATTRVPGAIVPPARMSNHLVGHAIDINVLFGKAKSRLCNSGCLSTTPLPEGVAEFIRAVEGDGSLRWGGSFATRDPVHIDDHLNADARLWTSKFRALQHRANEP